MKILITGANGLLGQKLTGLLQTEPDIHPVASARTPLRYPLSRGEFHKLDITSSLDVNKVISHVKPDVIINAAAMTQVDTCEQDHDECWKQNVGGVENLLKASEKVNAHFIHVSTDFIFDGSHGPLVETDTPNPVNYYGESKVMAETIVRQSRAAWTIIRTVLVYGVTTDMSRSNIVLWVKKNLENGKNIKVVDDQWRTPTLAEDLATGCLLSARKKAPGIFHVSGEEMMTPYDIAIRTAQFFKLDESLITPTNASEFKEIARRPLKTGFIIDKAKRELGFQPHSFADGLKILADQLAAL